MEVTNKNFKEVLGTVQDAIDNATFLAVDGEFTGLGSGKFTIHAYDTPAERYQKLKDGAMDFLLAQFGLCTFQYEEDTNQYTTRAFNFYLFPHPFSRQATDVRFLCQSSSIDFLVSQGFDFNKVFRDGIPFLAPAEENKLHERLAQRHRQQEASMTSPAFSSPAPDGAGMVVKSPAVVPEDQQDFLKNVSKKVEEFMEDKDSDTLPLHPCNGFQRMLIYQTLSSKYLGQVHLETKTNENKGRHIVVSKVSGEKELRDKENLKKAAEYQEIDDAVGFTKVIKHITASGKLMIGHNMLLDVLHALHKFVGPLPQDYEEFKSMTKCIFPRLLDTKLMASIHPFKEMVINTSLGDLQRALEAKPFSQPKIVFPEGFPGYATTAEKLHEAGYDAFITGVCFITMANHLGSYQNPKKDVVPPGSPLLEPFINKLNLMRVQDVPYINLAGDDLSPQRDHVFHIQFPAEWRASDIHQLFEKFGNVYIAWLDETSAFVGLFKRDEAEHVMKSLGLSELYTLTPYSEYKQRFITPRTRRFISPRKRPLPASDINLPASAKKHRKYSTERRDSDRHSITTIVEEGEEEAEETSKDEEPMATEEDTGIPAKRAKTSDNGDTLFEEPATCMVRTWTSGHQPTQC